MGDGNQARLVQTCETPADAHVSPQSVLALPLRQLFAAPLWLATTDPALMKEMIFLQLERRGLAAGRNPEEVIFSYRIVASVENKTLVLAVALPGTLPGHLCLDLRFYEPSARIQPLPHDAFTLWREDGRLVLAVTRGEELVYFQALGDRSFTAPVLQELQCVRLQLETENAIDRVNGITLWGVFTPQEISGISEAMDLPAVNAPLPEPVLPREWMHLIPASVRQTQHIAKARGRTMSLLAVAAGIYLLFLLGLTLHVTWVYIQGRQIENELKAHEDEVSEMQSTSSQWDLLDPAINPDSYPVELLLRTARLLPPDGVRFTFFETSAGKILIQGEASNAGAAVKFSEDLKNSKELRDYKFVMPNPPILPNGNAKFQIEGIRYDAQTH